MSNPQPRPDVSELLAEWRNGDQAALDRLIPLVYDELRRVAHAHLRRESPGHALQTTALVHEAYLRLVNVNRLTLADRTHFFAVSARLMRQILVDRARRERAAKRGGAVTVVTPGDVAIATTGRAIDILAVNEALDALATLDPQQSRVVELRFFTGLTIDETADALAISTATVERDWAMAKAWLYARLKAS
jgi:RNA polymerase sigma factor (TIGR02999 family)